MVYVGFHTTHHGGNASCLGNRDFIIIIDCKISECTASLLLDSRMISVGFHATQNGGNASHLGNRNSIFGIVSKNGECSECLFLDTSVVYVWAFVPLTMATMPLALAIET